MRSSIILTTIVAVSLAIATFQLFGISSTSQFSVPAQVYTLFSKWMVRYGRIYNTPSEHLYRLGVFNQNYQFIKQFMQQSPDANFDLIFHADLTHKELVATYTGLKQPKDIAYLQEHEETPLLKSAPLEAVRDDNFWAKDYAKRDRNFDSGIQYISKQKFDPSGDIYEDGKDEASLKALQARQDKYIKSTTKFVAFYLQRSDSQNIQVRFANSKESAAEKLLEPGLRKNPIRREMERNEIIKTTKDFTIAQVFLTKDPIPGNYFFTWTRNSSAQGGCGSCWAFSSKAHIESLLGGNVEVSAQHIVSCVKGNSCFGGFPGYAIDLVLSVGFWPESMYPYHAKSLSCFNLMGIRKGMTRRDGSLRQWKSYETSSNAEMMKMIYNGPGVGFIAGLSVSKAWASYSGGIFNPRGVPQGCGYESGAHSIYIAGYVNNCATFSNTLYVKRRAYFNKGQKRTELFKIPCQKHFILLNWWGYRWGINGSMRVKMSDDSRGGVNQSCFCSKPGTKCGLISAY